MTRELTCIVCPLGCRLVVSGDDEDQHLTVTGNRCSRGAAYAEEEVRSPKRMVTATCRIARSPADAERGAAAFDRPRRVPVKSSVPCPREFVDELLGDLYTLTVSAPVSRGARLVENWRGRGIDVVATRSIE